jgi:hypothetical protein
MARRIVQECDLTKQEYDPDLTVTLTIKKGGKKSGRTYELSPEAAEKLEAQLIGSNKLGSGWFFACVVPAPPLHEQIAEARGLVSTNKMAEPEPEDEEWLKKKRASLTEEERPGPEVVAQDAGDCTHMNKGPVVATMRGEERYAYRICKNCRKQIPEKRRNQKASYMGARAPDGINIKELEE